MTRSGNGKVVIPERFRDEIHLHLVRNLRPAPAPGTALILGIHGRPGEGKTYQVETCLQEAGVETILISGGQLESGTAGEPAQIVREAYLHAGVRVANSRSAVVLFNDVDAAIGSWGELTQYTVNTQNVVTELMHLADYPERVEGRQTRRVPIIVTGNDFTRLYGPLSRPGRMEMYRWELSVSERCEIVCTILHWLKSNEVELLVRNYPNESLAFWAAVRGRIERGRAIEGLRRYGVSGLLDAFSRGQDISPDNRPPGGVDQVRKAAEEILGHKATDHLGGL